VLNLILRQRVPVELLERVGHRKPEHCQAPVSLPVLQEVAADLMIRLRECPALLILLRAARRPRRERRPQHHDPPHDANRETFLSHIAPPYSLASQVMRGSPSRPL